MTWDLRHGDCLDPVAGLASLADRSVSHVICDPPYSERVHAGKGTERRKDCFSGRMKVLDFPHITMAQRLVLARQFARMAQRWIVVFSDHEGVGAWQRALERSGATWHGTGTWLKIAPMPRMDGAQPACATEAVCIAHAPRPGGRTRWNGGGRSSVYEANPQEAAREHPTQKPLALMEALVRDFTDPGDLVLDPFAGSCTTGVACRRLGRRFLGWEKDPRYFEIGRKRLANTREQLRMFEGNGT